MKSSNFPGRKKEKRLKALENLRKHRALALKFQTTPLAQENLVRIDREIETLEKRVA